MIDIATPNRSPPGSPYSLELEGPNPPCHHFTRNTPCLFFYAQVFFSIFILCIGVAGMAGAIGGESCFYSNLITLVVGLWVPSPAQTKQPDVAPRQT